MKDPTPSQYKIAAAEFMMFLASRGVDLMEIVPDVNFGNLIQEFEEFKMKEQVMKDIYC